MRDWLVAANEGFKAAAGNQLSLGGTSVTYMDAPVGAMTYTSADLGR